MPLKTKYKGTVIEGHLTCAAYDFFLVQIDSPFSDLKDGFVSDMPDVTNRYWYVRDNHITKLCQKQAKELLVELYQVSSFFECERMAVHRALLKAIEDGNEHYAYLKSHDNKPDKGFAIDMKGNVRTLSPEELAQNVDPSSFEEQRDYTILSHILFSPVFIRNNIYATWVPLAYLIEKHFGIKLIHPDRLGKYIEKRLNENGGRSKEHGC